MKTAVDSSVLLDVFGADPTFGEKSRIALRNAYDKGALVACDVTWAEVRAHFPNDSSFENAMRLVGISHDPIGPVAAQLAGQLWQKRRKRGVKRDRIVADFLIGAHALHQTDALLSRDRGFYKSCFQDLSTIDPTRS
jgi:predicted nucleic acid-binding protein